MSDVLVQAQAWAASDPDPQTREELLGLIGAAESGDEAAAAELADAFSGTLRFGTAGLRGRLGAGPNRMNLVVVTRAAAGLAAYVSESGGGGVVIGYDARRNSAEFARATAQVMAGAGLAAYVLPHPLPTPVLAFAIRRLGCAAGVMVTASHNPPEDNGYKVYLADGSQIVPPADAQISAHIDAVAGLGPVAELPLGDDWTTLGDDIVEDYVTRATSLLEPGPASELLVAYTPLHGVGGDVFLRTMRAAGFRAPVVVGEQFAPDPEFPTVAFPNPEEPGAMDLVFAKAQESGVHLVIAHDPDADRCAVGVPGASGWRMLTGDEVGALLGWWIASGNRRLARHGVYAQSIVSGSLLESIAHDFHIGYVQTLTGFKWIARVPDLMFGYEEALGYCVDANGVRDKDGITAALMVVEMAARLRQQHRTLAGVLDELARLYGVHATAQVSARVPHLDRIGEVMDALRADPPRDVAGHSVTGFTDLALGADGLPPTDGLRFTLDSGARIIVRPSGTEPKVKCYLQSVVPVQDDDLDGARASADAELASLKAAVSEWLS